MRACIIGLGSIGKRHIRVLSEIIDAEIIAVRSGKGGDDPEFIDKYKIRPVRTIEEAAAAGVDFAIVANPTALHDGPALQLAGMGIPFLIEKPVSHTFDKLPELLAAVKKKDLPVMVGFQMRHHPGYKKMVEWLPRIGAPLHCHGYVGQYLPDWRPGTDYRKNYSAISSMGGGVILDLCHQIDVSVSLMGKAMECSCMCGKCSDLEIETEDYADILLRHEGARSSHIHVNYLERNYEWYTRLTGSEGTIIWDYGKGTARLLEKGGAVSEWKLPDNFDRDTLFREQMKHWLAVLEGKARPAVGLEEGAAVTKIAVEAKNSSMNMRHIVL